MAQNRDRLPSSWKLGGNGKSSIRRLPPDAASGGTAQAGMAAVPLLPPPSNTEWQAVEVKQFTDGMRGVVKVQTDHGIFADALTAEALEAVADMFTRAACICRTGIVLPDEV